MHVAIEVQKRLERGFSVENLGAMSHQCMNIAKVVEEPLPYYVLASIFYDIMQNWDERTVLVDEAEKMEHKMVSKVKKVLDDIIHDRQSVEVWNDLNSLLQGFLETKISA